DACGPRRARAAHHEPVSVRRRCGAPRQTAPSRSPPEGRGRPGDPRTAQGRADGDGRSAARSRVLPGAREPPAGRRGSMSVADVQQIAIGALEGLGSSTVFILALFIGFCIVVGFTKVKRTAGNAPVVKSLDESLSRQPVSYLPPNAPRGPADQLHGPGIRKA